MQRFLALLTTLLLTAASWAAPSPTALKAGVFEPPHPAPEFTLQGSDGADLKLSRYRGKVVLLFFGFSQCPAVCPTTLATLVQARKALGKDADAVQVIFATVDPERDTVPVLKAYLGAFDNSLLGGTGKPAVLAALRKDYGVVARKVPTAGGGYVYDHTSSIFLIDRAGRLRALMPYGHEARDYVHDIRLLLAP